MTPIRIRGVRRCGERGFSFFVLLFPPFVSCVVPSSIWPSSCGRIIVSILYHRIRVNREDVRFFCREHPNGPVCVDVDWVLASVNYGNGGCGGGGVVGVPPPPFPPEPRPPPTRKLRNVRTQQRMSKGGTNGAGGGASTRDTANGVISTAAIGVGRKIKSSNSVIEDEEQQQKPITAASSVSFVFRGDVFLIVPSPAKDDEGAQLLGFGYKEMESTIIDNGGLMMSRSLLTKAYATGGAKKKTKDEENPIKVTVTPLSENLVYNPHGRSRKYYIVSNVQTDYSKNKLLAEASNLGIYVVPVSSVWVAACLRNDCKYDPEEYPLLFQPQTWPIRLLNSSSSRPPDPNMLSSENGGRKARGAMKSKLAFLMSVTGFADSSRYGIISMLNEIGAGYTDNLSRKNTHLICKEGSGQKYIKALEWGLHVVSVDWLYHVVRHGYEGGSEAGFSLAAGARKEPVKEIRQIQPRFKRSTLDEISQKEGKKATTSSLNDDDDGGEGVVEDGAGQSALKRPKTAERVLPHQVNEIINMDVGSGAKEEGKRATAEEDSLSRQRLSSSSYHLCHTQVDTPPPLPPMAKDGGDCPGQSSSRDEDDDPRSTRSNKRLHFALRALEEPIAKRRMNSNNFIRSNIIGSLPCHRRRGKDRISPLNTGQAQGTSPSSLLLLPPPRKQQSEMREDDTSAMSPPDMETQLTIGTILANADIGDISLNTKKGYGDYSSEEVPPSQADDAEDNGESQVVWFAAARG
jgi:hypothetical protein